jgi:hypothetical protein
MQKQRNIFLIRRVQMRLICTLFWFLCVAQCDAQTIRPVISEFRGQANGRFDLVNDSFQPVNVVLEAKSFTVDEVGEIAYRALDPGIQVKFSATSFRIQPKQTYTVTYQAKAPILPAYFVVYAGMSGLPVRTNTGLNIRVLLPHTVYILPKKDAAKNEIAVTRARYDAQSKKVNLELQSSSANMGRILVTEVFAGRRRVEAPGFPIYPGKNRRLDVEWPGSEVPDRAVFYLKDFKIRNRAVYRAGVTVCLQPIRGRTDIPFPGGFFQFVRGPWRVSGVPGSRL